MLEGLEVVMRIFPIEALKAVRAVLSGQPGAASLEIDLEPFKLDGDILKLRPRVALRGICG